MAGATFHGMDPWKLDAGIIECYGTGLGFVDLHNECDFLGVQVVPGPDADLLLRLMFRQLSTGSEFVLSFAAVAGLRIEQLEYHSSDASLFHDASHVPDGSGWSAFEIELASMRMEFRASRVEFRASTQIGT